jgi:hypothetical protein
MYLSTHYCHDSQADGHVGGYTGFWYGELGLEDPLLGLGRQSFWPTRDSLFKMPRRAGFGECTVTFEKTDFDHGPLICLSASTSLRRRMAAKARRLK